MLVEAVGWMCEETTEEDGRVFGHAGAKAGAYCHDGGADFELPTRTRLDKPNALNAQDSRKLHIRRHSLTCKHLGAIDPKGFDADEDGAGSWDRDRPIFELELGGGASRVNHGGAHVCWCSVGSGWGGGGSGHGR